jgi:hypothetical protein
MVCIALVCTGHRSLRQITASLATDHCVTGTAGALMASRII